MVITCVTFEVVCLWYGGSSDRSQMVDSLSYFSFQPVPHYLCNKGCGRCYPHYLCNKGCGRCYPVCGMVHINDSWLLIEKISLCGGSGFPFSLSQWSLTICLTPYNCRSNVLSASLNKTFLSFSFLTIRMVLNHMSDSI